MISGMYSISPGYTRSASTTGSNPTLTTADALKDTTNTAEPPKNNVGGIAVSQLKRLDVVLKPISLADNPALRDMLATNWLMMRDVNSPHALIPDNAPQNTYAQVKVDGKVVATVYNGGSSAMTGQAAGTVGDLQDPPGLGGPDLAQWRAENYARLLGGTIEKADTAITQSEWKPRESVTPTYTREQLDAAFQAMIAEGQKATAQRLSSYGASSGQGGAGTGADIRA